MHTDRFGDPAQLPTLPPLTFLTAEHVDRLTSLVMTLAAEVWALREEVARLTVGAAPPAHERQAFVRRLLDSVAPEPDPAQPVRDLADRALAELTGQAGATVGRTGAAS